MTTQTETTVEGSRSLSATLVVAFSGAIAVIMFNALPVFLGAAAVSMSLDESQVGTMVSAYFFGQTLMTIVAGLTLHRFKPFKLAFPSGAIMAVAFVLMLFVDSFSAVTALLGLAGVGGGVLFVLAMTVMAEGARATRDISICFMLQLLLAAVVAFSCPALITPKWGFTGTVVLFAALYVANLFLLTVYRRDDVIAATMSHVEEEGKKLSFKLKPMLALLAMTIFFAGLAPVWAFFEIMGSTAGFNPQYVGIVLAGSLIAGVLSSSLTALLENRIGLRIPILLAVIVVVCAMMVLVDSGSTVFTMYAVGVLCFQFGWVFGVNYIASSVAWLDSTGDHAPLTPAAIGVGIVVGPMIGGALSTDSLAPLLSMGIGAAVIVAVLLVFLPFLKGAKGTDHNYSADSVRNR